MLWSFICLSGCLFTLVLTGALNELRWTKTISLYRPVPPITIAGLPLDTEYADDVDFNDKEEENLGAILPQATAILEKWNLFVNEDKTDFTHAYSHTYLVWVKLTVMETYCRGM